MPSCAGCGVDIRWSVHERTGERIPLEYHAELGPGEDRYIVTGATTVAASPHHVVTPVAPGFPGEAYRDHRIDCPDHGNGLPRG
jgi:hypothetical protein